MMNFLNGLNLVPKNLIVNNIVDTLKTDPETGIIKLFEMSDKFASESDHYDIFEQVKEYYSSSGVAKMYLKNLIYNTDKTCLKTFIQNVAVHHFMEGLPKKGKLIENGAQVPDLINIHFEVDMTKIPISNFESLLGRAKSMGIHIIVLTGKFSLENDSFVAVCKQHQDFIFIPFIDSQTISSNMVHKIKDSSNFLPIAIIKALSSDVNSRLGLMKSAGVLYGSATYYCEDEKTSDTSDPFILNLIRQGSRVHFYITEEDALPNHVLKGKIDQIRRERPLPVFNLKTGSSGNFIVSESIRDVMISRQVLS